METLICLLLTAMAIPMIAYVMIRNDLIKVRTYDLVDSNNQGSIAKEVYNHKNNEIIIRKSKTCGEIRFNRPKELSNNTFVEFTGNISNLATQVIQAELPKASSLYTMKELQQIAPNGLFTSQVDPNYLLHFHIDDSYTTIFHDGKGIREHHGFKRISFTPGLNPAQMMASIMGLASIFSGQFYLKQINTNQNNMRIMLEKIIDKLDNEKKGKIQYAADRLLQMSQIEYIDESNLFEIRAIINTICEICSEYQIACIDKREKLTNFAPRGIWINERMRQFNEAMDDYAEDYTVLIEAERIKMMALITEIVMREKRNSTDPKLHELYSMFQREIDNSFTLMVAQKPDYYFESIQKKADTIDQSGISAIWETERIKQTTKCIEKMIEIVVASDINKLHTLLSTSRELVLIPGNNSSKQRLFISTIQNAETK